MIYNGATIEVVERDDMLDDLDILSVRYTPVDSATGLWTVIAHADGRDVIVDPDGRMLSSYFGDAADFLDALNNSGVL